MTKQERQWRPVVGFEDLYEVSNLGEVKSLAHSRVMPNGGVRIYAETILKNRTIGRSIRNTAWKPYQQAVLYYSSKPKTYMIHRLVAQAFITNPQNKPEVNHIDNNPLNNNVSNLEWVTRSENTIHAIAINPAFCKSFGRRMAHRVPRGEKQHNAKLTDEKILKIRSKYIPNIYSLSRLAEEYQVSKKLVLLIIQNKIWKHLNQKNEKEQAI